jgi:hypothetical protein
MATNETPARRRWTGVLTNGWPTVLAVALAYLTVGGAGDLAGQVHGLAEALPLLPLLYLVAAKLKRPEASWPLLGIGMALIVGLRLLDVVPATTVFIAIALIVLIWGAVDGELHRPGEFRLQALGMVVFGGAGVLALAIEPEAGRYLVAAGWLLHGVWDFVHLWRGKVVARSYAQWCGVLDVLTGLGLLFLV